MNNLTNKNLNVDSCNCYITKLGLNCDRITDIVKLVINVESDYVGITHFLEELAEEGSISLKECIIISTQIGILAAEANMNEMPIFSDN